MPESYGVMVCGHGSRSQAAVDEFSVVATKLRDHFPDWPCEYGYLEFANPVIRVGLDKLREKGASRILAVPGMLFAAGHAKNDIPSVLNSYQAETGIRVDYGRELGVDPKMIAAAGDRVREAIERADAKHGPMPLHETCLVILVIDASAESQFKRGMIDRATEGADGIPQAIASLLDNVTTFADRRRDLDYRRLKTLNGAPLTLRLRGHEFHYTRQVEPSTDPPLFDAWDSAGTHLGAMGARRANVFGSYGHIIAVEQA